MRLTAIHSYSELQNQQSTSHSNNREVAQKPHASAFGGATSFHAAFFSFLAQVVWDALISHSGNVREECRISPQAPALIPVTC
jgi:hypothetical protein